MKTIRLPIAFICASFFAIASTARADVINYTGVYIGAPATVNSTNMGITHIGQSGQFSNSYFTTPASISSGYFYGYIPAMSTIIFSFNSPSISSAGSSDFAIANISYNYIESGHSFTGTSSARTNGMNSAGHTIDGTFYPGATMAFASANLTGNTITAAVSNGTSSLALFDLFQTLTLDGLSLSGSYTITAISAVPLPAALPMFASLLLGMFGLSRHKRKTTSSIKG